MFKDRLPHVDVRQTYGATECGIITTDLSVATAKAGSVGVAAPGMIIKVVDLDTEDILGPNQNGEIRVKGPQLMKGYINGTSFMDDDGYYKTGDIGYFDEDKYFFVINRIKDTIYNKFGAVSPVDVEDILLEHPAVIDAAVVSKPDPDLNEVAAGFVVKRPGCDVTESELVEFVANKYLLRTARPSTAANAANNQTTRPPPPRGPTEAVEPPRDPLNADGAREQLAESQAA